MPIRDRRAAPAAIAATAASAVRVAVPAVRVAVTAVRIAVAATAIAVVAAGCATSPDPRPRSISRVEVDGHGGWIALDLSSGKRLEGELIAVDTGAVRLLTPAGMISISQREIAAAELWAWDPELGGTGVWGIAGTASTFSHGYFLLFSAPIWVLTSSIILAIESRAPRLEYPAHGWDEISHWARFPQGLPPNVYNGDLVHQRRAPPAPQAPQAPQAPAPPAPVSPAPASPAPPAPAAPASGP